MRLLQGLSSGDGLGHGVPELLSVPDVRRHIGLLAEHAVAADKVLEVHGFDRLDHGRLAVADRAERQSVNGDPIGCKQYVCPIDESHDGVVVRVGSRLGDDLHALSAESDVHPIRVGQIGRTHAGDRSARHLRAAQHAVFVRIVQLELGFEIALGFCLFDDTIAICILSACVLRERGAGWGHRHVLEHVLVANKARGIRVHVSTGGVIPVRVTVDHEPHWYGESSRQLGFEPVREFRPDRLDEDNPLGGDHECRKIVVHPSDVHVTGQALNLLALVLSLLIERPLLRPGTPL